MLLHCSSKLATKLTAFDFDTSPHHVSEFSSWHGHLVTFDRRQCLFFCHDASRFMLVLPGAKKEHFTDLAQLHRDLFAAVLEFQGVSKADINAALLATGALTLDLHTNRSVMGSIRTGIQDFEYGLWHQVHHVMQLHPVAASAYLNDRPTSINKKFIWPRDEIQNSIAAITVS